MQVAKKGHEGPTYVCLDTSSCLAKDLQSMDACILETFRGLRHLEREVDLCRDDRVLVMPQRKDRKEAGIACTFKFVA